MYYIRQESRRVAANICDAVELGLASPPAEGKLFTKARRTIGVAAVRAHAAMIIEGVKYCGPGGEEAYRRRHEVKQQADKYRVDLDATWHAHGTTTRTRPCTARTRAWSSARGSPPLGWAAAAGPSAVLRVCESVCESVRERTDLWRRVSSSP